jgi:beta-xylosidase
MDSKTYIMQKLRDCLEELNSSGYWNNEDLDEVINEAEYLTKALKNTQASQNS